MSIHFGEFDKEGLHERSAELCNHLFRDASNGGARIAFSHRALKDKIIFTANCPERHLSCLLPLLISTHSNFDFGKWFQGGRLGVNMDNFAKKE